MGDNRISMFRGDDNPITLTITDSAGDAVDITGYTFFMTVKKTYEDSDTDAIISKTVKNHTDPTGGITTITLTNSDTSKAAGVYKYDIQMKTDANLVYTLTVDDFILNDDVTRRTT